MASLKLVKTLRSFRLPRLCWTYNPPMLRKLSLEVTIPANFGLRTQLMDSEKAVDKHQSFVSLFENSSFVQSLEPAGKKVKGEVISVVGDHLYVDFGCKFHAVVKRPEHDADCYVEGANVVLLLRDLEMTMHPLGSSRDISLLEAEAELCGLAE